MLRSRKMVSPLAYQYGDSLCIQTFIYTVSLPKTSQASCTTSKEIISSLKRDEGGFAFVGTIFLRKDGKEPQLRLITSKPKKSFSFWWHIPRDRDNIAARVY